MNPELQAVVERLEKVEKENRILKRFCLAILLMLGAAVVMGQARPVRIVEAESFVLKDSAGQVRARLAVDAPGKPMLSFLGDGRVQAALVGGDEPGLTLNRNGSDDQVVLSATRAQIGLGIYQKAIRAGLAVINGVPGLDLFDENGEKGTHLTWPPNTVR